MNTSEVLNKAADLIEKRGWKVGGGWPTAGSPEDAPLCLEGGIAAALGITFPRNIQEDDIRPLWECRAYAAVVDYLGAMVPKAMDGDGLWRWNDRLDRTAEQVIATLRACAVIEAAKETAGEREHAEVSS